ncbi:MAG: ATP-binding protein [Ignavibacterium album]|uniref:ATP-binding protein n=1 Tax=Ignavibacterium album TaxID=591197 RepID=UPI0026E9261A|nr:ATP-binding protein [Ignavibacterium album]MCX8105750.1 ATP-binding protein [Ignavibacterium album]
MQRDRYLSRSILSDLKNKMVFVGGARQVGKTTLARDIIAKKFDVSSYYNWDFTPDRKKIISNELPGESSLLIFDEIHKYKKWKTFIKGIFDTYKAKYKIIVTGSARLNIFRKGGDSLQGRYHYYTLHPFSLAEIENIHNEWIPFEEVNFGSSFNKSSFEKLQTFGGFPEPFLSQDIKVLRRWHNEKSERLFREDIRDVENIRDINSMMLLRDILPSRAASPLSINNLSEDLEVSHRAITNWLNILDAFYYTFRIYPFTSKKIRSIKKESKLYLIDWSEIENEGNRFENMIASHLLKFTQYLFESEGYKAELFYLRNVDKKEVDFLVTINNKPWFSVEAKLNDKTPSPNIIYFKERLKIPYNYQVIKDENIDIMKDGIRVISASKFLSGLI